jgi:hypothetical protein
MSGKRASKTTKQTSHLGVAVEGIGVGVQSELHVGYVICSVDPHVSYTLRL